jgi:hypothetical protein
VIMGLVLLTQINFFTAMGSYNEKISKYDLDQSVIYNQYLPEETTSANYNVNVDALMATFSQLQDGDVKLDPVTTFNPHYGLVDEEIFDDRDTDPFRMGSYYFHKFDTTNHQYEVVILHNTTAFQSVPTYYNAIAEAIVQNATGKQTDFVLYNHPLPFTEN